ncbi:hypothetical protein [Mycobacteroides abscessus]|uniref:hypothetical protein n=1 Tax=Mycobacteroides abscessus TaxID=36809 RepID=UPI0009286C5D|nr:hypothetical protein [Mycobacteroides abscessus]SHP61169.1 Uncharacterised protein [Mycobacteroides abscessus subsp. abscessus]
MKAVLLSSTYYLDEAVQQLSPNAERMLTRALAFCGNVESSGYISELNITMLGLPNPKKLVRELVDADILVPRATGGWDFRSWQSWNSAGDALVARRKSDRDRQARLREKKSRDASRDSHPGTNAENHGYSPVGRAKTGEKSGATTPSSDSRQNNETSHEQHKPISVSRDMSRDVTPPNRTEDKRTTGYVESVGTDSTARDDEPPAPTSAASATPGAELVRRHIDPSHPGPTKTALRIQASELIRGGTEPEIVTAALQLWNAKPGIGIGRTILASLASEVIKSKNPRATPALSTADQRVAQVQALKNSTNRLELT